MESIPLKKYRLAKMRSSLRCIITQRLRKRINVTANAERLLDVFMETDDLPIDEAHFPDKSFRKYVSWRFDSSGDKFGRCISR